MNQFPGTLLTFNWSRKTIDEESWLTNSDNFATDSLFAQMMKKVDWLGNSIVEDFDDRQTYVHMENTSCKATIRP